MEIKSLLDTDLYKLTMMQVVYHHFSDSTARFVFKNRTQNTVFTPEMAQEIKHNIESLEYLFLTLHEKRYLETSVPFLSQDFINYLSRFHFNMEYVTLQYTEDLQELHIEVNGPWVETILFEVPILAIVNSIYFKHQTKKEDTDQIYESALTYMDHEICKLLKTSTKFADFGTRRRFSAEWHRLILQKLKETPYLVGTSNVYLAKKLNLKPIGTMAHEFIQAGQAFVHPRDSQQYMLDIWAEEYQGNLGIALSDTLGFKYFLHDFNLKFMKLYDGVRLDSGDPEEQCRALLKHYQSHNIDPLTKTVVFSDGLDFDRAAHLQFLFGDCIKVAFGIGTFITNSIPGYSPLQIVMKMTHCNGLDVAKISDTPGKTMCKNPVYLKYLQHVIQSELSSS